jgi:glycosyltransferase involved in cell wall biosynthesis
MNNLPQRAMVVLGMHRSGTSAISRLLALCGGAVPRTLMPPAADNPQGYWESKPIAAFNDRLLASAGTSWRDDDAIPETWFNTIERVADRREARTLLKNEFPASPWIIFKDPRVCRLVPFWQQVFTEAGIETHWLLTIRDPVEVAASLAARADNAQFRPAAIRAYSRGLLLWLRYVLDASRYIHHLPHTVVSYADLLENWRRSLDHLFSAAGFPTPSPAQVVAIDSFIDPQLRRQRDSSLAVDAVNPAAVAFLRSLANVLQGGTPETRNQVDVIAKLFDNLQECYKPLRKEVDPLDAIDPWSNRILDQLATCCQMHPKPRKSRSIVFFSADSQSISHIYRVEHTATALSAHGWATTMTTVDDPAALQKLADADLAVVFRSPWTRAYAAIRDRCSKLNIPLVYDIDDLLFDQDVTSSGQIAFLDTLTPRERRRWISEAADYQLALQNADFAVLSTAPLAEAARSACRNTFVLPNALDEHMETAAAAAVRRNATAAGFTASMAKLLWRWRRGARSSLGSRGPRLVFASGTPTHHRDFAVAVDAIAAVFSERPEPVLVIIGHLDPTVYPVLRPFSDRIVQFPTVPFLKLFDYLADCDINLCPLEPGNAFCESKSAVRWLTAATVGVPSVVSSTAPLRDAVVDGLSGFMAESSSDWQVAINRLLDDPKFARQIGEAARVDATARFGFENWAVRANNLYHHIVDQFHASHTGVDAICKS